MEVVRAVQARQATNPKTVLGFYAGVLALLLGGCIATVAVLAETHTMTGLIPWVLGFGALGSVALVATVIVINVADPSKLMLGQISGIEYSEIQRARLGDSLHGEHDVLLAPGTDAIQPSAEPGVAALPASVEELPQ